MIDLSILKSGDTVCFRNGVPAFVKDVFRLEKYHYDYILTLVYNDGNGEKNTIMLNYTTNGRFLNGSSLSMIDIVEIKVISKRYFL